MALQEDLGLRAGGAHPGARRRGSRVVREARERWRIPVRGGQDARDKAFDAKVDFTERSAVPGARGQRSAMSSRRCDREAVSPSGGGRRDVRVVGDRGWLPRGAAAGAGGAVPAPLHPVEHIYLVASGHRM
ncbi:MAG: hypothetical protein H6703_08465 [Myxococcales bacterium]|nr:hypothetical protein [Myxococcales bacterium]